MKSSIIKIVICFVWAIGVIGFVIFQKSQTVNAKNNESKNFIPKPDLKEVEKFNALILDRFLTEPQFGGRRVMPTNPHLENFAPKNILEENSINYFEKKGWKMGIFLFGRIANFNSVGATHLNSYYHSNEPVAVTKNIKQKDLPKAEAILSNVAKAYSEFQDDEKLSKSDFEFNVDGWWYSAKPVRAVNESCVKCHQGNVAVKQKNGTFQYRERKIGDVNGVLVYAFQK